MLVGQPTCAVLLCECDLTCMTIANSTSALLNTVQMQLLVMQSSQTEGCPTVASCQASTGFTHDLNIPDPENSEQLHPQFMH